MKPTEILDKRIATATRRYAAALEDAESAIAWEKSKLVRSASDPSKPFWGTASFSGLQELLKLNQELGALLALKDQIENQAKEAIA